MDRNHRLVVTVAPGQWLCPAVVRGLALSLCGVVSVYAAEVELPLTAGVVVSDTLMVLTSPPTTTVQDGTTRQLKDVVTVEVGCAPVVRLGGWRLFSAVTLGSIEGGRSADQAYASGNGQSGIYESRSRDVQGQTWQVSAGLGWLAMLGAGLRVGPTLQGSVRREAITTNSATEFQPVPRLIPSNLAQQTSDWYVVQPGLRADWDLPKGFALEAEAGLRLVRVRGELDLMYRLDFRHPGVVYRGTGWGWGAQSGASWTAGICRAALVAGADRMDVSGDAQLKSANNTVRDLVLTALDRTAVSLTLRCGLVF